MNRPPAYPVAQPAGEGWLAHLSDRHPLIVGLMLFGAPLWVPALLSHCM
jgi:hypothetical protein